MASVRSGSAIGKPRISTAFTNVNTVALTPMPIASATAATRVNHLSFRSSRAAKRTSSQRPIRGDLVARPRPFPQGKRVELVTLTQQKFPRFPRRVYDSLVNIRPGTIDDAEALA